MRRQLLVVAVVGMLGLVAGARGADVEVVSVKKIWDKGKHNAFTDLVRFKDQWFCVFRESEAHVGGNGVIRVLTSGDGEEWKLAATVAEEGIDLRDPKVSVTPEGKLMLLMGGSVYEGKKLLGMRPRVAFSADGAEWTKPKKVLEEGDWLWRAVWHEGVAWGTSYKSKKLWLCKSTDGVKWERATELEITGRPNETALHFLKDGRMVALVRREEGNKMGWIGTSAGPDYTKWEWNEIGHRLGGPEFVVMGDGTMWAGGREWEPKPTMVIARMGLKEYEPVVTLPSGGDCSYPGMVWDGGFLWVSYYSSHEGKGEIYLAKLKVRE